jgi:hypothetical protein
VEPANSEAPMIAVRYSYAYQDGTISPITAAARLADAKAIAQTFDASHIHELISRYSD